MKYTAGDSSDGTPPYPCDRKRDLDELQENEQLRRKTRWRRVRQAGTYALVASGIIMGQTADYLYRDIQAGKEAVSDSQPVIHTIYETDDPNVATTAVVVATGLGTNDASATAKRLEAHRSMGDVYAIEYGNKDINIDAIVDAIIAKSEDNDIENLIFDGYSAGGAISMVAAERVISEREAPHVAGIILNGSPIGNGSLTGESQSASNKLDKIYSVCESCVYSEKLRFLTELGARRERFYDPPFAVDWGRLREEANDVSTTKINNNQAASGNLIASQNQFIRTQLALTSFKKILENDDPPQIFYTMPYDAGQDAVVNVAQSVYNLRSATPKKATHVFSAVAIKGIGHANPGEATKEYNFALSSTMLPIIRYHINSPENTDIDTSPAQVAAPK